MPKNNLSGVSELRQKQFRIYKKLMKEQRRKENEDFKRQGRKKKHIDINGIIDSQLRVDGIIQDIHHNRVIQSKAINMYDYRFKNQGGSRKPLKFHPKDLVVLYNVQKVTLENGNFIFTIILDDQGNPIDMRIVRGIDGRGMGNAFYEKKIKINFEPIKDKKSVRVITTQYVNHLEENPKLAAQRKRESVFQSYSMKFWFINRCTF